MHALFFLLLTFYTGSYGGAANTIVPTPYDSVQHCDDAGRSAKQHYTGGAVVDWTCVPASAQ